MALPLLTSDFWARCGAYCAGRVTCWGQRLAQRCVVGAQKPGTWSSLLAACVFGIGLVYLLWPMLMRWDTYGFHDWDLALSHRYVTRLSLVRYRELPLWNPWMCGGFPAFAFAEGAPNLVSPYLPLYWLFDLRTAFRCEVIAATALALAGTYAFARRFTRSVALAASAAALFGLNGRWALQLAVGHSWHLQFCWLPWALYALDRAQENNRASSAVGSGVFVALAVFAGGVYPVPYTALVLVGYALLVALQRRSLRPLRMLAITGAVAFGLAAPKLLPMTDVLTSAPRPIESPEAIGIGELAVMLTARGQRWGEVLLAVPAYDWHEWGIYIGAIPFVALMLAALLAHGVRENALRVLGLLAFLLGLGAFHARSPWALLHRAPIFSSLHVPSRVHIVMVLLLAITFVAWAARYVDRLLTRAAWLDFALLLPVAWLVFDLATESQPNIARGFWVELREEIQPSTAFKHHQGPTNVYSRWDFAGPMLPTMMANQGVIDCYGIPDSFGFGALAVEHSKYRGMAEVVGGPGRASLTEWSPNRAVVRVRGADAGALVVYNMNYDAGWRANGSPALDHEHRVAARLGNGETTVVFEYSPRRLLLGTCLALSTLIGIAAWLAFRRR